MDLKFDELLDAYKELWAAVENGFENDKFFELRRRFKQIITKAEGKTNENDSGNFHAAKPLSKALPG